MSDETAKLELQVDAMLREVACELNRVPGPGAAVRERVKAAVRQELNERWLAGRPEPTPREALLDEVKQHIREELGIRSFAGERIWSRVRGSRLVGGLAAAAMVLICVGLIRQVGLIGGQSDAMSVANAPSLGDVDFFVEAAQVVLNTDDASSLADDAPTMRDYDRSVTTESASDRLMDDLTGALQEVMEETEPADDAGQGSPKPEGALG